jgi:hypothetical protein
MREDSTAVPVWDRFWFRAVAAFLLTGAALFVFWKFDPVAARFPACPFYTATGLYCPGCGSQRALHSLMQGDVVRATEFNLLMVLAVPALLGHAAIVVLNRFRTPRMQSYFEMPRVSQAIVVLVIAYWILRNLPWMPFRWLAPG